MFPSSAGSNLQALINSTREPGSAARIVVVVSNKAAVAGLDRAERAGIPTRVSGGGRVCPAGCAEAHLLPPFPWALGQGVLRVPESGWGLGLPFRFTLPVPQLLASGVCSGGSRVWST